MRVFIIDNDGEYEDHKEWIVIAPNWNRAMRLFADHSGDTITEIGDMRFKLKGDYYDYIIEDKGEVTESVY